MKQLFGIAFTAGLIAGLAVGGAITAVSIDDAIEHTSQTKSATAADERITAARVLTCEDALGAGHPNCK